MSLLLTHVLVSLALIMTSNFQPILAVRCPPWTNLECPLGWVCSENQCRPNVTCQDIECPENSKCEHGKCLLLENMRCNRNLKLEFQQENQNSDYFYDGENQNSEHGLSILTDCGTFGVCLDGICRVDRKFSANLRVFYSLGLKRNPEFLV